MSNRELTLSTYRQFKHEILARAANSHTKYKNAKSLLSIIKSLLVFQVDAIGMEKAEIEESLNRLIKEVTKLAN